MKFFPPSLSQLSTCFLIIIELQPAASFLAVATSSRQTTDINNSRKITPPNSDFSLAKTKESFKLSDLYFLETEIESQARNLDKPTVIGINANTGSYLLKLDQDLVSFAQIGQRNAPKIKSIPISCMSRFDWITTSIIASGSSGEDLVNNLSKTCENAYFSTLDNFTLEYVCMGVMEEKDYTSKNLLYRVVQCIPAPAALSPKLESAKLSLIETPTQIYLAQRKDLCSNKSTLTKRWSTRPYQYSSAINPTIALIVVDILLDLILTSNPSKQALDVRMLDATCGSGTFLAFALDKGMDIVGNDINEKCVDGSLRNLRYMFNNATVVEKTNITTSNFCSGDQISISGLFDCAVTNLPWGVNSEIKNKNDNSRILQNIHRRLRQNCYCAIVSKSDISTGLISLGFKTIGKATVPQADFSLPGSTKRKKTTTSTKSQETSCNCVITIVQKSTSTLSFGP